MYYEFLGCKTLEGLAQLFYCPRRACAVDISKSGCWFEQAGGVADCVVWIESQLLCEFCLFWPEISACYFASDSGWPALG